MHQSFLNSNDILKQLKNKSSKMLTLVNCLFIQMFKQFLYNIDMSNLTISTEDYLEAIYMIELENNSKKVHSVAVAKQLGVTKAAVSRAMNYLARAGLITKELYGNIFLTEKGLEVAKAVYDKHMTIKKFLMYLGVSEEVAGIDCCKIEHIISDDTYKKIQEFNLDFEAKNK